MQLQYIGDRLKEDDDNLNPESDMHGVFLKFVDYICDCMVIYTSMH